MDAIRVNRNIKVNQVSSRTQLVRSDSNLIDFFDGDSRMKICLKCKQTKPLSEFNKNRSKKDGFQAYCKTCQKIANRKYLRTEKGKITYQIIQKCYRLTENHKIAHRKTNFRYYYRYPERCKARNAVRRTIQAGKISRPDKFQCSNCPAQAQ